MKRNKIQLELSRTELEQLLLYAREREKEEWYYGNRKQFDDRHYQIIQQLCKALDKENV